ncbi:ABC transporter permease [Azoarcus sp. DN11]|uniref:ABC transporter permease n=1 Tax=Azoarcus sp. DN11 TaxID=356837 RepID=UPI000EAD76FA|nr:ABC transporter permease [Azoarcus sp. DN11]AYH42911.1 hypothetical protein CDA09_05855 [Azoarcus sp. DN11]
MSAQAERVSAILPWRGLALPLLLVAVWELAVRAGLANPQFLPPVQAVVDAGAQLVSNGELWVGLAASLGRNLAGLAVGSLLGVALGIVLGVSRIADRAVLPTLSALKQISPFALIPLLSFWFGLREPAKVAFIVITCVFPILVNTYEGVRSVPAEYLEVGRACRFGPLRLLWRVILPAAAPSIFTGLHMGVFFAWLGTVGAEYFFAAGAGVGNTIIDGRNASRMDLVLFGVFVIGLTGYLLNRIVALAERRLLRWRPLTA